jgi:malate dehydrogenase (oxaloacetate-decarboxylating)
VKIPEVFQIEVEHTPGSLAKVLDMVGKAGLTIEGLEAVSRTGAKTLWELTLELSAGEDELLTRAIDALPNAKVAGRSDRVFTRHRGGKIETVSKVALESLQVLRDVYTPGVARVCLAIQADPECAREYTNIHRTVAIVTNGTAILGLGRVGAVAGMPVMEGKAALFHALAGLSGVPILIESEDPDVIVDAVRAIAPSFGAIQLEDIRAPECFEIERRLQDALAIPVLHDDQHGTAVVVLAAFLSGTRAAGLDIGRACVGQIGLGAAGIGIGRLLHEYGVGHLLGSDLNPKAVAMFESFGGKGATLAEVMARADVVIATTGARGLIKPSMVRPGQLIFALSNPDPEIEPVDALAAGARFAADGKNINNVLGFPGLFRGALEARAPKITQPMLIAAAETLSRLAPADRLVPDPLDRSVHVAVATAVRAAAASTIRRELAA